MTQPTRIDLLELDLDTRLHDLWAELSDFPETLDHSQVSAFMRAAYGKGFCDALTDPDPLEMFRTHGYAVPRRAA